jgi:hypothetical protein
MTNREQVRVYNRFVSADLQAKALERAAMQSERFQRRSSGWFKAQADQSMPAGFRVLRATVYTDGEHIVVTAHPHDVCEAEDWHNCDEMGCGWEHVLLRGRVGDKKE